MTNRFWPSGHLPGEPLYTVEKHLAHVQALHATYKYNNQQACDDNTTSIIRAIEPKCWMVLPELEELINLLLTEEDIYRPDIPQFAYQPHLSHLEATFTKAHSFDKLIELFSEFFNAIPPPCREEIFDGMSVQLTQLFTPYQLIGLAYRIAQHYPDLQRVINTNLIRASGYSPEKWDGKGKLITPDANTRLSKEQLLQEYLADTPFLKFYSTPVPFTLTAFKSLHWMITARTGHGKSQLLGTLVLQHLQEQNPPPIMVIDSQGQLLDNIERLACFSGEHRHRLVVVDPAASPALNMFDVPSLSDEAEVETLALFNYIFSAIDAELTSRQGTAFSYVVRLMLAHPKATILTLLELMEEQVKTPEQSRFWPTIQTLDDVAQSYFRNRFFTPATRQTKEQLSTRLYGVLRVKAFQRMFAAERNKLDLHDAIENSKVVLINTNGLGEASSIFGRYMIALALQAAFRRDIARTPHPALLFVDEAFDLMDENINRILIQARKFGLFIRFATQQYDQIPNDVRAAAAANTEVKLAGGLSADDARRLAAEFRTTADWLLSIRKHHDHAEWACIIQNVLQTPITLQMPFGQLEGAPHSDTGKLRALKAGVRAALAAPPVSPDQPATPQAIESDDFKESY